MYLVVRPCPITSTAPVFSNTFNRPIIILRSTFKLDAT